MTSSSSSMFVMPAMGVQCKGISMPIPTWKDASDLAMVRDWLYPHRRRHHHHQKPDMNHALLEAIALSFDEDDGVNRNERSDNIRIQQKDEEEILHANYRRAIDRVDLYKWRDNTVPHAIVATAALIDAKIHYETGFHRSSMNNHSDNEETTEQEGKRKRQPALRISSGAMKSIYAMAFCRFVNGFVDRDVVRSSKARREAGIPIMEAATAVAKEKGSGATQSGDEHDTDEGGTETGTVPKAVGDSSMYAHAAAIGMPSSFVDLRHKATHGRGRDLPSLSELQSMTDKALKWLWDKWWSVHARDGDAELRLWEVDRWDRVMEEHTQEMVRMQQKQQQQQDRATISREAQWQSITENGVTRFVHVQSVETQKNDHG